MQHVREDGECTGARSAIGRRKKYFKEPMNEQNKREWRVEQVTFLVKGVPKISKNEVSKALKRLTSGKAVGPHVMPLSI